MKQPRVSLLPVLGLSLLAAAVLHGGVAHAEDPLPNGRARRGGLPEPAAVETGVATDVDDVDPAAYDVPDEILIDARDDLDKSELGKLASDFGLTFEATALEAETKEELARVPHGRMNEILERLSHDKRVEIAEPLGRVRAMFVPNDPLFKEQWHMERIGASKAWDFASGRGVTVAVVDTGIACENYGPFMKGTDLADTECVSGWNLVTKNEHANDDQGHGTHVAGTIAQSTNNGIGGAGVAFHARLMPVKVLNESGWGTTADVADGIRWAAEHGAHVINLSLGGPRNSRVLQKAVDYARSQGCVIVAAAGNSGGSVGFPGASEGVIGVSASDSDDKIAKFSSRGDGVDIAAPGVNVTQQTICNKGRDKCERFPSYNGTSMASPHVAGAAALLVSLGVTDPAAVEQALKSTARVVDDSAGAKKLYGAGILQAANATESVTLKHAATRLLALLGITALITLAARRKNQKATSPFRLDYWLPALVTGPGLFFFAPWILPRVHLAVDLLARPLADMDLLAGVSVHRWLPLANVVIPFALTAVGFGVKKLRPAIAGFAAGTAAYLASVVVLGDALGPMGKATMILWCGANALACAWVARTNLAEVD